jgi:hypothetical protein
MPGERIRCSHDLRSCKEARSKRLVSKEWQLQRTLDIFDKCRITFEYVFAVSVRKCRKRKYSKRVWWNLEPWNHG